jgi:hypothetical protein
MNTPRDYTTPGQNSRNDLAKFEMLLVSFLKICQHISLLCLIILENVKQQQKRYKMYN